MANFPLKWYYLRLLRFPIPDKFKNAFFLIALNSLKPNHIKYPKYLLNKSFINIRLNAIFIINFKNTYFKVAKNVVKSLSKRFPKK